MVTDTSVLKDLGFTDAQIKIYIALTSLGKVTSGEIIKKTGLQSSVVYNCLNQLTEKGLVGFTLRGKRKYFFSTKLDNLRDYIDDKKEKINKLITELPKLQTTGSDVQVFEGWRGIYSAFNFILEELPEKSEYLAFAGDSKITYPEKTLALFREFQKKRSYKKLNVKIIANEIARESIKEYGYYSEFGKPKYKFVNSLSFSETVIFSKYILILDLGENPFGVLIKSKNLSDSYRKAFLKMWTQAKS